MRGAVGGSPTLERITPSDVEQKVLVPVLFETGVATARSSLHGCSLQIVDTWNLYPDLVHHPSTVQFDWARDASMSAACAGELALVPCESGPREARLEAKPRFGYIAA